MARARTSAQARSRGRFGVPLALIFFPALLAANGAPAFEGRYVAGSRAYSQELTVVKRADGRFDVKADVATRGCAGEVAAMGAVDGAALRAEAKDGDETCALTLRRTKKGVSVAEDHCLLFHGAACEFSGEYRKR